MKAQIDRSHKFGTTKLTLEERIRRVIKNVPDLSFVEERMYNEGFTSASGSNGGKTALVFISNENEELLFTKGEANLGIIFGLNVPEAALKSTSKTKTPLALSNKTPKDLFK